MIINFKQMLSKSKNSYIYVKPQNKFLYCVVSENDKNLTGVITLTAEEFEGIKNGTHCFSDDLTAVREMTAQERSDKAADDQSKENNAFASMSIIGLKKKLSETDYLALKFAEGELSAEDFASIKNQRVQWRAQINLLEEQIKNTQTR